MLLFRMLMMTAMLAGMAGPAAAGWERVGAVGISHQFEHELQYGGFSGPVTRIQLRAINGDVVCRSVRAQFGNREQRALWSGTLTKDVPQEVDVPENRLLRGLDFLCRARDGDETHIDIFADAAAAPGGAWSPPAPKWTDDGRGWNPNDWVALGAAWFSGTTGKKKLDGAYGRHVKRIGLRATGGNAQCHAMMARFLNGQRVWLTVNRDKIMRENRIYQVDLPEDRGNIRRIVLICAAVQAPSVSILVYANK